MKPWQLLLVAFSLLATAGCRTDPAVTLLERDNFRKDKEIWRLRGCIEDLQDELNACQHRPELSRPNGADMNRVPRRLEPAAPAVPETPPDVAQPTIEMPSQPAQEVPRDLLKRPAGQHSPEMRESPEHKPSPTEPGGPSLDGPPGPAEEQSPRPRHAAISYEENSSDSTGDSQQVASITLNRRLTGGIGANGAGDQGLLVVVEPRDATGRTIDAPAEVSVVAYDSAIQDHEGHAVLVARWNFTAAETAALFRHDGQQQAIHLSGGWGKEPPKHSQLDVFVRYVTADGRNLEAHQQVEVALRTDRTARRADSLRMARRDEGPIARRPEWSPDRR